jgi:hypothetical protein
MKSKNIEVLNGKASIFKKGIKDSIEYFANKIAEQTKVSKKSAYYMLGKAFKSNLIEGEIYEQIEFYINQGSY